MTQTSRGAAQLPASSPAARGLALRLSGAPTRAARSCFELVKGAGGRVTGLRVANSRGCWRCLERLRMLSAEEPYEGRVQLRKIKEHYIFTVESVGQMPPELLFTEALQILQDKTATLLSIM